jgi:hypothetical protein
MMGNRGLNTSRWIGELVEVVLRHGPRAQVLQEGRVKGRLEGAYLTYRTPDKTGELHQI